MEKIKKIHIHQIELNKSNQQKKQRCKLNNNRRIP